MFRAHLLLTMAALSAGVCTQAFADPAFTCWIIPDAAATAAANTGANAGDVAINGQNVTIQNVGDQVVMDLHVSIAQSDGNQSDDGFEWFKAAFSSKAAQLGSSQGVFNNPAIPSSSPNIIFAGAAYSGLSDTGMEFNSTDPGAFLPGGNDPLTNTAQQTYPTGTGGPNANPPARYLQFTAGPAPDPIWGDGSNTNAVPTDVISSTDPTEFFLGSIIWTATSTGKPAGPTDTVQVIAQPNLTGIAANKSVAVFYSDSPPGQPLGSGGSSYFELGNAPNLFSGSPVLISALPEPTSLTLVVFGISLLSARIRRRTLIGK